MQRSREIGLRLHRSWAVSCVVAVSRTWHGFRNMGLRKELAMRFDDAHNQQSQQDSVVLDGQYAIIVCRKCGVRYRLPGSQVKVTGTRVRCSRCRHEFTVCYPVSTDTDEMLGAISSARRIAEEASLFTQAVWEQMSDTRLSVMWKDDVVDS